jgi:biopolymer transport protein ExbB/TolQ
VRLLSIELACERAAAQEHRRLAKGMALVGTISATAPLAGLLLTVWGMANSFKGCGCEKSQMLAMITGSFAEAFLFTALGLALAIFTWTLREYLRSTVAEFDTEMRAGTLDIMNEVRRIAR